MTLTEMPSDPVILTGGGCGLNGSLQEIFRMEDKELVSYPGQAISYPVIEEWAELGIGAGILPTAKISTTKDRSITLILTDQTFAKIKFDWKWNISSETSDHIRSFVTYIKNTVPLLVKDSIL